MNEQSVPAPSQDGERESSPTPICSIGASAGGVVALQEFFRHVSDDLGAAFVVVVHLAPDRPSALSEILSMRTRMPVRQVDSAALLQPNCVYVIPPDRELVIRGDDVAARPFSEPRGRRSPIDMLFRSVAAGRGDGIAVVLSGSGSDGALGVRAVKEAGGVIFVQDPAEAEYPMMPRSAIATGVVDVVAPIAELVRHIAEVIRSKDTLRSLGTEQTEPDLRRIIGVLRARTGHDFANYKRATIVRRVGRRMQVTRQDTPANYYRHLIENPHEVRELLADLLISVTMFFRDRQSFAVLTEKVIRPLFDRVGGNGTIRAWVVGCATGEEAYSIGMIMLEEAGRRGIRPAIQIFASDLDDGALAIAREGRYPRAIETDVSDERLRTFFVEEGPDYRVRKELRELVLFTSHSALKDPPFIKLDLLACRNLLIYLQRDLQRHLCTLFHYALQPDGVLFLGSAETADATPSLFDTVDREARIYAARLLPARQAPVLPQLAADYRNREHGPKPLAPPDPPMGVGRAHAAALEQYAPPSVLVDRHSRILHLSQTAGLFLRPPEGPFNSELPAMVRPELRVDVKLALLRALEHAESIMTLPIPVDLDGSRRLVVVNARPVVGRVGVGVGQALVFFLDAGAAGTPDEEPLEQDFNIEEVKRLRQELGVIQDRLSSSRGEHEQAIQDLRAANEELQSINEEYRSTAEELETSKEELQSMNEELQTVNMELKTKLEAISSAHNDFQNLMAATEIGTLFLDPSLRIKLFTPAVVQYFNITGADIGRAISDFTHRLLYDNVEQDALKVLRTLVPVETEMMTQDGGWLMMRLRPYRTVEDRIEGVVLTFDDITSRTRAEKALEDELRAMTRLQQLSTRMLSGSQLETSLEVVLEATTDMLRADFGTIQRYDEATETLRIAVQRGFDPRYLEHLASVGASGASVCGMALARGAQVLVEDTEAAATTAPVRDLARSAGYRAVQATPLFTSAGRIVGMLSTQFREPRHFSSHDLRLIDICARHAADTINAHLLQQSLRESESRLRKVLETDAVGVTFFDNAGTLIDGNEAFFRMTGYSRQQVEARELTRHSMTPTEWLDVTDEQLRVLEGTGRLGPYEKEYVRRDGTRRWMLFAGRRIEENLIAEYCIDISDRKRVEHERELLSRELSHRVKNTLAVVQALALQTTGESVESYRETFVGRLGALAKAHSLLLETDWRNADLNLLVREAVAAYRSETGQRVRIDGEPLQLSAKQALGLSLVLHELATNALKYGALSQPAGRLTISWTVCPGDGGPSLIKLLWQEQGGPVVQPPTYKGFGAQLITRACEYELGGEARLNYASAGLICEIAFPIE